MMEKVEDVRASNYQSFESLPISGDPRDVIRMSRNHGDYVGKDISESVAAKQSPPSKRHCDTDNRKTNGFSSPESSWVVTDRSESSTSGTVKSASAFENSQPVKQTLSGFFTDEMTPEYAFTQYQRRSEDQACQVCGQPSVGFHHRAYVCEACKKFFTRHLTNRIKVRTNDGEATKSDNSTSGSANGRGGGGLQLDVGEVLADLNVVCPMGGKCKIEGPGRGKCPHCRFRKCLDLGMSLTPPGGEIGCDVSKIPCRVCGGPSSGFHFGALTCEGCKGFFRRTVHSSTIPQCLGNQTCRITPSNRNMCKSCRFKKCLDVGMSQKRSRVGRQPNAIKYYCVREISQRESNAGSFPKNEVKSSRQTSGGSPKRRPPNPASVPNPSTVSNNGGGGDSIVHLTMADFATVGNNQNALLDGGGVGNRSRASTFSVSSGLSSVSGANCNSRLDPAARDVKMELGSTEFEVPAEAINTSFGQQFSSASMMNAFASPFLRSPFVNGASVTGSCVGDRGDGGSGEGVGGGENGVGYSDDRSSAAAAEFFSQLAKHPTMVAAAASILMHQPLQPQIGPFQPQQAFPIAAMSGQCQAQVPPSLHLQQQQQQHQFEFAAENKTTTVGREETSEDSETATDSGAGATDSSPLQQSLRTPVFVTLAEFTQGIERATDFLRSERLRVKRSRLDSQPRFNNSDNIKHVWSQMMHQFVAHTKIVVDFSKLIAGFNRLGINDKRQLIRAAMYPIMLIELSRDFKNNGSVSYNYFDFQDHEKDVIIRHFPPLTKMISHLIQSGKALQQLNLDDVETTIICTQELLRHKSELEDPASCEHLFLLSMQALVNHEQLKFKSEAASERLTAFTQLLPMLNQLNIEHHEALSQIRLCYPHLVFPELYLEMFAIGADDPPHFFQSPSSEAATVTPPQNHL